VELGKEVAECHKLIDELKRNNNHEQNSINMKKIIIPSGTDYMTVTPLKDDADGNTHQITFVGDGFEVTDKVNFGLEDDTEEF
jgi:hypothetical protein